MSKAAIVSPETFVEVARLLHHGKPIAEGVVSEGFVMRFNRLVFVGYHEGGDTYIVAKMKRGRETVGTHDPKLRTHQNEYVRAEFARIEFDQPIPEIGDGADSEQVFQIYEVFEMAERIDTGYYHGYRVTPIDEVVDDIFKWYDMGDDR